MGETSSDHLSTAAASLAFCKIRNKKSFSSPPSLPSLWGDQMQMRTGKSKCTSPMLTKYLQKWKQSTFNSSSPNFFVCWKKSSSTYEWIEGSIRTFSKIDPKNNNWHNLSLFLKDDTYISSRWDTYSYRYLKPQIRSLLSQKQECGREGRAWAPISSRMPYHKSQTGEIACRFFLIIFLQITTFVSQNSSA